MTSKVKQVRKWGLPTSPWYIIGSAIILLTVVVVFAVQNYNREKKYMSRILSEKGAAIIRALEAGARTGMMGMMWGGQQVQTLIEETAKQPDVLYISIINDDNAIVASSRQSDIGRKLPAALPLPQEETPKQIAWRLNQSNPQQLAFEVYRGFKPLSMSQAMKGGPGHRMMERRSRMMGGRNKAPWQRDEKLVIVVALDAQPFVEGSREDLRNSAIISFVLLALGFAGFISMFWKQSYQSTRQSLQDTSAIANQVVTSLPVGLIATDKQGRIAFFNDAAESLTGLDLAAARGKDADQILPDHFCGLKTLLDEGGAIFEKEMECEFAPGRIVPVSISASKIINEAGMFVGHVLIFRDLGEVRRLQDEIRRTEKLAAIGDLAAGVAHEIRNPLSSLKGIASYYLGKFEKGQEDQAMAQVMIEEVDRMSRVVSELLEFANPAGLNPRLSDIHELLNHSTRLIHHEATAKNIQIQLETEAAPRMAKIDPDRFSQCLLNLYQNAMQAMGDGGTLTVECSSPDESSVVIKITDTGDGIPPEDISKIFDPYFTTKPSGTGLGLAIVHKIIEAHQGTINVRSTLARGTVFTINLPQEQGA